eukprot:jgi/Chlat1/4840/Chrsp31S04873
MERLSLRGGGGAGGGGAHHAQQQQQQLPADLKPKPKPKDKDTEDKDKDTEGVDKHKEDKQEEGEGEGEEAAAAVVVFQCGRCRAVVGDSTALVRHPLARDLAAITLHAASNIQVADSTCPQASTSGADAGSTYLVLKCKACGTAVGRVYRATPRHLDVIRDMLTFSTDALCSYQIGTSEVMGRTDHVPNPHDYQRKVTHQRPPSSPFGPLLDSHDDDDDVDASAARVLVLEEQLLKAQNLLLLYNERLERLEQQQQQQQHHHHQQQQQQQQ